jgi:hypothetical protein
VHPLTRNEDLTIVTFDPLPGNPLYFEAVRGVIRDFLRDEKGIPFEDIQPSSLGQSLVCLTHPYHRDTLVRDNPHVYDNVTVTFQKHNEGRNWRRAEFNHECWFLLLGFPNGYWTERHI